MEDLNRCKEKLSELNHQLGLAADKYQNLATQYDSWGDTVKSVCYQEAADTLTEIWDPEIEI